MTIKIVLRDRCYIPAAAVNPKKIKATYEVKRPTKEYCRAGCPLAQRRGKFCSTCPGKDAVVKMWSAVTTPGGKELIAVPTGDLTLLSQLGIKKYKIVDDRPDVPFRSQLEWKGRLFRKGDMTRDGRPRPNQRMMVGTFLKHVKDGSNTGGLIISPPRSGKCVVGSTLILTDDGVRRIDSLFADKNLDIETIGRFGQIRTPTGVGEIRGLYSKEVDQVVDLLTSTGCRLTGTPNHPVLVRPHPEAKLRWMPLGELTGRECVVLPTVSPIDWPSVVGANKVAHAGLLGYVVAFADPAQLAAGYVDIDISKIASEREVAELGVHLDASHIVARSQERIIFPSDKLPLRELTVSLAERLGYAAWRAYLKPLVLAAVLDSAHMKGAAPYLVFPKELGRLAHMYLISWGVRCTHINYRDEAHIVFESAVQALSFLDGARIDTQTSRAPHDPREYMLDEIASVRRINVPTRVYDVMVPDHESFNGNGVACHNTVIGVASIFGLKQRAFITASQVDFLRQFCMRFGENSNVRELYRRGRYPVVLIDPTNWEDGPKFGVKVIRKWGPEVKKADVVLSTYQQLLDTERGRERIKKYVNGKFAVLMIDEVHQAAADAFSRLANRLNVRYKLGLTATRKRKDGLEEVLDIIMGPTVVKGEVTSIVPRVELWETGITSPREYKAWTYLETFLVRSEERNRAIVKQVFKDLRANKKHNILIPTRRTEHVLNLIKMINAQAAYNNKHRNESWPVELAVAFRGGSDRSSVLKQVEAGKARVVVANTKMTQHGLDVQRWTHVYIGVIPTSNTPLMYQLANRVCTSYSNELEDKIGAKPEPIVRFMIDAIGASVFCFAKIFLEPELGILAGIQGTTTDESKQKTSGPIRYKATQGTIDRMAMIAKFPKSYSPVDVGVKKVFGLTKTGGRRKVSGWKSEPKKITKL